MQTTLTIIKPDAVAAGNAGNIIAHLQKEGFQVLCLKMLRLTEAQAKAFYEVHAARPFYGSLVEFMTSGPVIPIALARENAVLHLREVMGATDPKEAATGTIRKLFAVSKGENSTHGSDSPAAADREIAMNFRLDEIVG